VVVARRADARAALGPGAGDRDRAPHPGASHSRVVHGTTTKYLELSWKEHLCGKALVGVWDADTGREVATLEGYGGMGSHSSTFQLDMSTFCGIR
jgi:hypothetical protein